MEHGNENITLALAKINAGLNAAVWKAHRSVGTVLVMEAGDVIPPDPKDPFNYCKGSVYLRIEMANWKILKDDRVILTSCFESYPKVNKILRRFVGKKIKKVKFINRKIFRINFQKGYSIKVYYSRYYDDDDPMLTFTVAGMHYTYSYQNGFEIEPDKA